ncbi:hypothetical protein BT96DRAFT_999824 [Gymnopus androsaceus JB14]|uniref:HAD-like protein n=1 Tax=Gymnopus androsaceus JB14 TaxID=1447944 RepID=A0A6A4H5P3_9AGAR|nr:hypothetical protein BT96DRAFT_999824 [Gymnopus androsaceus JB14]
MFLISFLQLYVVVVSPFICLFPLSAFCPSLLFALSMLPSSLPLVILPRLVLVSSSSFNPVDKRTETTESTGKLKRVTKGMTGIIIELCSRNKTEELENKSKQKEPIGLLAIFDPPREDTKQTIDGAMALGVKGLGHLCAMTGDGANGAPVLSCANVGFAVEGATDAARGAADIVLTEPGLSTIVHAIRAVRFSVKLPLNSSTIVGNV